MSMCWCLYSARPGRPPKRTSSLTSTEVALEQLKRSKFTNFGDFYAQNRLIGRSASVIKHITNITQLAITHVPNLALIRPTYLLLEGVLRYV